jgi:ABC-type polysaccharide/polyol phosphate transport system ATPase subunit
MTALIELRDVCVDYPIYDAGNRSIKNVLIRSVGGKIGSDHGHITVNALANINLSLREGDRLAVIGHNGAGKSTLLKVLARIYEPTGGQAVIEGRISSLLDITMGMDPDATGYENIVMRGALLGRPRSEVLAEVPQIEDFTGLGDYLDLPIRTYSTGMMVRLAFAISTNGSPDILIMDEMVGAADAAFAAKAQARINDYVSSSKIVVFASHDPNMLLKFCNKGILLQGGSIIAEGPLDMVLDRYAGPA